MEGTEPRIPDNSRVKLRDYIGKEFYAGMAKSGNEGWVRKHRTDRNGLPEVYIEWDREHWADNAQPDRWTFEEHFDIVEKGDSMPGDISPEDWKQFQDFLQFKQMQEESESATEVVEAKPDEDDAEQREYFDAQASHIPDLLEKSESFFFLSVHKGPATEDAPKGELIVSGVNASLSPEAELILGMQLSGFSAKFHSDAALTLFQQYLESNDADS